MVGVLDILKLADSVDKKQKREEQKRKMMERVMSFDDPGEADKAEEKPKKSLWGKKPADDKKED